MAYVQLVALLVLFAFLYVEVICFKLTVVSISACAEYPKTLMTIDYKLKMDKTGTQKISFDANFPMPIDDNLKANVYGYVKTLETWTPMFILKEKDPCNMLKKYLGEAWFSMQTNMNLPRQTCPIPKGKYHLIDYVFNMQRMTLQLPRGRVKISYKILKEEEVVLCHVILLDIE